MWIQPHSTLHACEYSHLKHHTRVNTAALNIPHVWIQPHPTSRTCEYSHLNITRVWIQPQSTSHTCVRHLLKIRRQKIYLRFIIRNESGVIRSWAVLQHIRLNVFSKRQTAVIQLRLYKPRADRHTLAWAGTVYYPNRNTARVQQQ
jgi:hypothetical protein